MEKAFLIFVPFLIQTIAAFSYVESNETDGTSNKLSHRDGKFIAFVRIQIPGPICASGLNPMDEGYCDGVVSCLSYYGKITGLCTNAIGVCCVVTAPCGRQITNRVAYFTNQGLLNTFTSFLNFQGIFNRSRGIPSDKINNPVCASTVIRFRPTVTQLRLDFIDFNLAQPDASGACATERLVITIGGAAIANVPDLCGINTGNHIYVRFNAAGAPIVLTAKLALNSSSTFNIKISQIDGLAVNEAPAGCLQYFPATSGTVQSFNFGGNNFLDFNYTFCVRVPIASVTWNAVANQYMVGSNADPNCVTTDRLIFGGGATNIATGLPSGPVCFTFPPNGVRAISNSVTFMRGTTAPTPQGKFRLTYRVA